MRNGCLVYLFVDEKVDCCDKDHRDQAHHQEVSNQNIVNGVGWMFSQPGGLQDEHLLTNQSDIFSQNTHVGILHSGILLNQKFKESDEVVGDGEYEDDDDQDPALVSIQRLVK